LLPWRREYKKVMAYRIAKRLVEVLVASEKSYGHERE
jgi:hypothetical protein